MSRLIEIDKAVCRYRSALALDGVSLGVGQGEWLWIMGPSGSGKTTLLRALAGLEPLESGSIALASRPATAGQILIPPNERGLAFLPQEMSLWPHLSCLANTALGAGEATRAGRADQARRWLDRLGVGSLAAKFPGEISGGEARRVALARALAARPSILLLDEPTAHLDLHLREALMDQLRELHREEGLTTLCVMHQIEPPMAAADRALLLEGGRALHDGALAGIVHAPPTPFVRALERLLARPGGWKP